MDKRPERRQGKGMYSALVGPHTRFGLKLFREIARQEPDKNVVVSPMSVGIALAMVYNGAAGDTREAMARVLELGAVSPDAVDSAHAALLAELDRLDSYLVLTMTNKIEVGNSVKSTFLQTIAKHYKAEVVNRDEFNAIKLTNSIRFKGAWTESFDREMTREHPFTLLKGDRKPCLMMSSPELNWAYYQDKRFQLVRLPYGERRASMYILLPGENAALSGLLEELLTPENWTSWLGKLVDTKVEVALPRFEVDYTIDLNDVLSALGMEVAFNPARANFDAMCFPPAWVDRVSHQAWIAVDEAGTEASVETLVEIVLGKEEIALSMVVDRPFFYAVQDDRTGMLLLLGQTVDPAPWVSTTWEQRRRETLSDALDLMMICMEDGLSFDEAMAGVYEKWNNELALGFGRVLREILLGRSRRDALKAMAERMDMPDLTLFVNAVIEADQTGESLLEVVRSHAQMKRK